MRNNKTSCLGHLWVRLGSEDIKVVGVGVLRVGCLIRTVDLWDMPLFLSAPQRASQSTHLAGVCEGACLLQGYLQVGLRCCAMPLPSVCSPCAICCHESCLPAKYF